MAARAVVYERDFGFLLRQAYEDQWRDVIVMAAGLAPRDDRNRFIADLVAEGDRDAEHRQQLHLLAVACLETAIELEPQVRADVSRRLRSLIPPRNMTEAKELASAGDWPFRTWRTLRAATLRPVRQLALEHWQS